MPKDEIQRCSLLGLVYQRVYLNANKRDLNHSHSLLMQLWKELQQTTTPNETITKRFFEHISREVPSHFRGVTQNLLLDCLLINRYLLGKIDGNLEMKKELDDIANTIETAELKLSKLESERQDLLEHIGKEERKFKDFKKRSNQKSRDFQKEIESLKSQQNLGALRSEKGRVESENRKLKQKIKKLQALVDFEQGKVSENTSATQTLKAQSKKMKKVKRKWDIEKENLKERIIELERKEKGKGEALLKVESLKSKNEELRIENDLLKEKALEIPELLQKISDLKKKIGKAVTKREFEKSLKEENLQLRVELKVLKKREKMMEKFDQVEHDLYQYREMYESLKEQMQSALQSQKEREEALILHE